MEKTKYIIAVDGCDGTTEVEHWLSDTEFALINQLAVAITTKSSYGCEPTMRITIAE